ncbi:hypothetical protein C8R43DRAFT_961611 [Mycena crocata]|nr:hypothetical protein C8R43DRAFT_961611 [Mycena crocata]
MSGTSTRQSHDNIPLLVEGCPASDAKNNSHPPRIRSAVAPAEILLTSMGWQNIVRLDDAIRSTTYATLYVHLLPVRSQPFPDDSSIKGYQGRGDPIRRYRARDKTGLSNCLRASRGYRRGNKRRDTRTSGQFGTVRERNDDLEPHIPNAGPVHVEVYVPVPGSGDRRISRVSPGFVFSARTRRLRGRRWPCFARKYQCHRYDVARIRGFIQIHIDSYWDPHRRTVSEPNTTWISHTAPTDCPITSIVASDYEAATAGSRNDPAGGKHQR